MIDGVAQRLANYREGIDRVRALIARRSELIAALPPARERFEAAIASISDPAAARELLRTQNQISEALLAHNPLAAERAAQRMRQVTVSGTAVRDYADAIVAVSEVENSDRRSRQGSSWHRRPADRAGDRPVARRQRSQGSGTSYRFRQDTTGR